MLSCDIIREKSTASIFGNNIFCLMEVDSTNTFILNMARSGAPEGTLVISDYQQAGRGKLGRVWFAPKGQNLTFSVLLRPTADIEHVQKITLAVASTLADTIEDFFKQKEWTPVSVRLKWPNDLLINGKKVSGILSESVLRDKEIAALAIGFGINLNTEIKDFPEELQHNACSLVDFSGQHIIPEELLALFLSHLETDYEKWERNNYRDVVGAWKQRCDHIGKTIKVVSAECEQEAQFDDVDEDGYLLYRLADGTVKQLISGEIQCS